MKGRHSGNSTWRLEADYVPEAAVKVWFHKGEAGSLMRLTYKMKM